MRTALVTLLLLVSPDTASGQATASAVREALDHHDLDRARSVALAAPWDLSSPEGRERATAAWLGFLRESHRRATELHRAGRAAEARDIALALIAQPPVLDAPAGSRGDAAHFHVCASYCDPDDPAPEPTVLAPTDRRTTQRLEDLALFLMNAAESSGVGGADVSDRDLARQLLTQIVGRFPNRATALLNLADLEWADGHDALARASYRRFQRLRGARTPARVLERLREPRRRATRGTTRWVEDEGASEGLAFETASGRLGELSGGTVSFHATRGEAGWGYWESVVTLTWRSGAASHRHRVLEDVGRYAREIRLAGGRVCVSYDASGGYGGEDSFEEECWTWDADGHRFRRAGSTSVAGPYVSSRTRTRAALQRGDFEAARGALLRGGTSAGVTEDDPEIFADFVEAAHRVAARHARAARPERAADVCRLALRATPVLMETIYGEGDPTAAYAECARWWGRGVGASDRVDAIAALTAFGELMGVRAADPEVDLAFADALHDLGEPGAAAPLYARYLSAAEEPVARARERAAP